MFKRVTSFLVATCIMFSMVFSVLLTFAPTVVMAGENDIDATWQTIRSIVHRYEKSNVNIHKWNAITNTTKNPASQTMPETAILGNGHVGVTSKNTETEKAYILSSTDFWSDNSKVWGYSNRNPQISIGGELVIAGKEAAATGSFSEYQNILDAEIYTQRELGGLPVEITTWMAPNQDIIVSEITSKGETSLPLVIKPKGADNRIQYLPVHAGVAGDVVWGSRSTNINPETYGGENTAARWVSEFVIASKVLGGSNHSYASDEKQGILGVDIAPGETIYVVTAAHTQAMQPINATVGSDGAGLAGALSLLDNYTTKQAVDALSVENTDWWENFYKRSWVDMGDNALNRAYYDSQYIYGSASRSGAVASGLYGVWITHDTVKWQGDYHLNYNMQAPYYGAYSSNRTQDLQPQFDVYLNWMDEGIGIAGDYTRLRGISNWYVDSRADLKDGIPDALLYPVSFKEPVHSGYGPSHGQTINALFCASQIIAYYRYTQDLDWLLTKQESWEGNWYSPYDFLAKTANFYEGWAEKRGPRNFTEAEIKSGYYEKNSINNATSGDKNATPTQAQFTDNYNRYPAYNQAEHGDEYVYIIADSAHEGGFELNPSVTVGNVQNLLKCLIEIGPDVAQNYAGTYAPTGETVNSIYGNKFAVWQDMNEHMADYMQGAIYPYEGRSAAYKGLDIFGLSEDRWIRHLSATVNLEFIHPGYELGFDSDPDMLEIARNSVLVMGNAASPGWGQINNTAKIFTQGARVGYNTSDLISRIKSNIVNKMKNNGHVNDGNHGWEKSGVTEALNTLMLAESGGIIKLFPYWENASAEFNSIRVPGAFLVSSASKNGDVSYVDVTSEKGGVLNLVIPWDSEVWDTKVLNSSDEPVAILGEHNTVNSKDRYISLDTTANSSYRLVRIPGEGARPEQPLALRYTKITNTSIGVAWEKNPAETDAVNYEVRYSPIGEPENQEIVRTENTEVLIGNLQPETMYQFEVYAFYRYATDNYSEEGASFNAPTAPNEGSKDTILLPDTLHFDITELEMNGANEELLLARLPAALSVLVYDSASNASIEKKLAVGWDISAVQYDTTHPQSISGVFLQENQVENPYNYLPMASLRLHSSTITFAASEKQALNNTLDIASMENVVDWNMVHNAAAGDPVNSGMQAREFIGELLCNTGTYTTSPDFWIPVKFDNGTDPVLLDELALNKGNVQGRGAAYFTRGAGNYYEFEVDAQPFEQELIVVTGGNRSIGELTASFDLNGVVASGGRVSTAVTANKVTGMTSGAHNNNKGGRTYIIRFSSTEAGQKLRVRLTLATDLAGGDGQILIKGAVLRQVGTPFVEINDLMQNGQIEFSPANPIAGELVTASATAEDGYVYVEQSLSLNGSALLKNENGEYTFIMPYGSALLSAVFSLESHEGQETLEAAMQKADLLDEGKYTTSSWELMRDAYVEAETLLQSGSASDSQMAQAAITLENALDAMVLRAQAFQITLLKGLIGKCDELKPDEYPADLWKAFSEIVENSRRLVNAPANAGQNETTQAYTALSASKTEISKHRVDRSFLAYAIQTAKAKLENENEYVPVAVELVKQVLQEAEELMLSQVASQADINAMVIKLTNAITTLGKKGDKTALALLIEMVEVTIVEAYTPSTWTPFEASLAEAQKIMLDENADTFDVDGAFDSLVASFEALQHRADFGNLKLAIEMAENILANADKYAPTSLLGLAEALDVAKVLYNNLEAGQDAVDAQQKALYEQILKAYFKANKDTLATTIKRAKALSLSNYTSETLTVFYSSMQQAEVVFENENATQSDVENATLALNNAVDSLAEKPTPPNPVPNPGPSGNGGEAALSKGTGTNTTQTGGGYVPPAVIRENTTSSTSTAEPSTSQPQITSSAPEAASADSVAIPDDKVPLAESDNTSNSFVPILVWVIGGILLLGVIIMVIVFVRKKNKKD